MRRSKLWTVLAVLALTPVFGCSEAERSVPTGDEAAPSGSATDVELRSDVEANPTTPMGADADGGVVLLSDAELEPWRRELLDIAHESASKFPLVPHGKNRARAQEKAAVAALELDLPDTALRFYSKIENWRRGAGYADLAYYKVTHGDLSDYEDLIRAAEKAADGEGVEEGQAWRRQRVLAKIAAVYVAVGRLDDAQKYQVGLDPAQTVAIGMAKAEALEAKDFDAQIRVLDETFESRNFDHIIPSLEMAAKLYERFFDDEKKRAKVRKRVSDSYDRLPKAARINSLRDLAEVAVAKKDAAEAKIVVSRAVEVFESGQWRDEDAIKMMASLAELSHLAGDRDGSRKMLARAIAKYEDGRERIANIYRADVVLEIAEAFHAIGDRDSALRYYKLTLEEGVVNPNSRPRCDDLVATICSLVLGDFKPDEAMTARIKEISKGLGEPW